MTSDVNISLSMQLYLNNLAAIYLTGPRGETSNLYKEIFKEIMMKLEGDDFLI